MLKYTVNLKPGGFTAEELKASGDGGADAVVIVSIVRDGKPAHTGAVSFAVLSADIVGYQGGEVPGIPVTELYQVMTMLAAQISDDTTAPTWQRNICADVMEKTRAIVNHEMPAALVRLAKDD